MPTSQLIFRISSSFLPSGLVRSMVIILRTSSLMILSSISRISGSLVVKSSAISSANCCRISSLALAIAASRSCLLLPRTAAANKAVAFLRTEASISSGISVTANWNFSLPTSACIFSWKATVSLIASCPNKIASSISCSETSLAPASTIITASLVPATSRSMSLAAA